MKRTAKSLQKAFKHLFPDEVLALKELVMSLPDNPIVVNIGAGAGTSGLAFMESRKDLRKYTIDIRREKNPLGSLESEGEVLIGAGLYLYDRQDSIHGDSKNIGLYWPSHCRKLWHPKNDYKVDMVFIDGDHTYEGCKGDIEAWLPNIRPDGIIAVHDYHKQDLYNDNYHQGRPHPDYPAPKLFLGIDQAVGELLIGKYDQIMRVGSLIAFRVE
jgi:hypothetical protein